MKRILLAASALAMLSAGARADTIDPLHGMICATSSTCSNAGDNGTDTPINQSSGTVQKFGFSVSPSASGTLELIILTPNNDGAVTDSITGNGFSTPTSFGASLGVWSSGTLATFLGINSSPDNPIGAYLPTTKTLDAGATGFNVYAVIDTTNFNLPNPSDSETIPDEFNLTGALPVGSYIVGFFNESGNGLVATANSGALFVDTAAVAPVPGPVAGAGIPGLLGALGLGGFLLLRRKRDEADQAR